MINRTIYNIEDWLLVFRQLTEGDSDIIVRCGDWRQLLNYLHKNYINVKAAGGILEDADGRRLLMVRNDRFDLPKGKVEDGETLAIAALRETSEETGLVNLELGPLLLKTYHIYNLYGGWHFKQTTWYAVKASSNERLVPQTDEGISDLRWMPVGQWKEHLERSYATMRVINSQVPDISFFKNNG
ncbi:MAG: NUDIX domain-containing protein [Bacteroidales bacterium]|nr:NUDIX domain-containing protein [Bacteroidales bacterium]